MLITAEEAERRLHSSKNLMNSLGLSAPVAVRPVPKKTVTAPLASTELRVVAGTEAHFKPAAQVAAELNITEQQVRSAKNSESGTLRSRVEQSVKQVEELALLRTLENLELLTPETMANEKPRDIASVAAQMSKVYANIKTKEAGNTNHGVQFIVYAPMQKSASHFDVIEAGVAS